MAALCAGENTDKSGSRYVKPSLEGRFLENSQIEPKRCSFDASRRAISRGMLQSAQFLGLANDFGLALIRKITWPAPYYRTIGTRNPVLLVKQD